MAIVKPMAPVPLACFPQILPLSPPRRWRADSTRSITCSADAGGDFLPGSSRTPGGRSGTEAASASALTWAPLAPGSPLAGESPNPAPSPYAPSHSISVKRLPRSGDFDLKMILPGSEAAGAEAGAYAARCSSAAGGGRAHRRSACLCRWERDATVQQGAVRRRKARRPSGRQCRGLRVYLQDEHGTSIDALDYMISRGVKRTARDVKSDAYAAVMILERYFSSSGQGAQIVLPRQQELQDKLILKSRQDADV